MTIHGQRQIFVQAPKLSSKYVSLLSPLKGEERFVQCRAVIFAHTYWTARMPGYDKRGSFELRSNTIGWAQALWPDTRSAKAMSGERTADKARIYIRVRCCCTKAIRGEKLRTCRDVYVAGRHSALKHAALPVVSETSQVEVLGGRGGRRVDSLH